MALKENLLATGYFIDNDYLDQYLKLITARSKAPCYQERHHIINEVYFKKVNLPVDNSEQNLIWLSFKDHCKAHYLLYFCTCGFLKKANEFAFTGMIKPIKQYGKKLNQYKIISDLLTDLELDELQKYMEQIVNDSNSQFWSKTDLETLIKYYPEEGYAVYKRFPGRSPETVKQKAVALKLKVKNHFWTNEQLELLISNYPKKSILELSYLVDKSYAGVKKKLVMLKKEGLINENLTRRKIKN